MTPKLTKEQQQAVQEAGSNPVEFLEPDTGKVYVLIAKEQLVTRDDVSSIQRGIAECQAGLGRSAADSETELRTQLGFEPRQ